LGTIKTIGFLCCFNEVDFISYVIKAIIDHLDELIIVEGSWLEYYKINGNKRSCDGSIEILKQIASQNSKIKLFHHNDNSQLEQRNRYFQYCPKEPHWLWLIDADEIYDTANINRVKSLINTNKKELVYRFQSLTFVNNFVDYCPIEFPRLFKIDKDVNKYTFVAPNDISYDKSIINDHSLSCKDIEFFHFSYCKSPKRFLEKRKERIYLHGQFSWNLDENDKVFKNGVVFKKYTGEYPEIIKSHPNFKKFSQ